MTKVTRAQKQRSTQCNEQHSALLFANVKSNVLFILCTCIVASKCSNKYLLCTYNRKVLYSFCLFNQRKNVILHAPIPLFTQSFQE